jgi:RNA recognition motif-containing protein
MSKSQVKSKLSTSKNLPKIIHEDLINQDHNTIEQEAELLTPSERAKRIVIKNLPKQISPKKIINYFSGQELEITQLKLKKTLARDIKVYNVIDVLITFSNQKMTEKILKKTRHTICGKKLIISNLLTIQELEDLVLRRQLTRLYIRKLPKGVAKNFLEKIFREFGEIEECYVVVDKSPKKWNSGFVVFRDVGVLEKIPNDVFVYKGKVVNWTCHSKKVEKRNKEKKAMVSQGYFESLPDFNIGCDFQGNFFNNYQEDFYVENQDLGLGFGFWLRNNFNPQDFYNFQNDFNKRNLMASSNMNDCDFDKFQFQNVETISEYFYQNQQVHTTSNLQNQGNFKNFQQFSKICIGEQNSLFSKTAHLNQKELNSSVDIGNSLAGKIGKNFHFSTIRGFRKISVSLKNLVEHERDHQIRPIEKKYEEVKDFWFDHGWRNVRVNLRARNCL